MAKNTLEDRVLKQVEDINEGILSSIARLFTARKMKSQYRKAYKIAKDDRELRSALADLEGYQGRLNKILKTLCKRNPNHPKCD